MKLTINLTPKEFEMVNFLLKRAHESAVSPEKEAWRKEWKITIKELDLVEKFRMKFIKGMK